MSQRKLFHSYKKKDQEIVNEEMLLKITLLI